jgi:hypothetical protein
MVAAKKWKCLYGKNDNITCTEDTKNHTKNKNKNKNKLE